MQQYQMKAHAVHAQRIEAVQPLRVGGDKMLSPDAGIILRLESGKKLKWLAELGVAMPRPGDYFIEDTELATTFVVTAEKFSLLFTVAE